MRYAWFIFLPPIIIAAIVFAVWARYRKHSHERSLKNVAVIAHTHTVKMLPAYRRAVRRYRLLLIFTCVCFLISTFSFTIAAARPTSREEHNDENESRDVVLCLDVSGSMSSYQASLLELFMKTIDGLHGQRVGLTIFDGVPANLIPLSDDYDAVAEIIQDLIKNFSDYSVAVMGKSVSMIGDGVVGCVNSFNLDSDDGRHKSLIIATDNYASSSETVDINQAARFAKRYNITFYGISINYSSTSQQERLFQNAVAITGGSFYNLRTLVSNGTEISSNIINKVLAQEAAKVAGNSEISYVDSPDIALIISAVSFIVMIALLWRLRL